MTLQDRTQLLTTPDEVDAFLERHPRAVLLKLGTCHKNTVALREVEKQLALDEELPLGLIRVVEARPASNRVAARTGIVHESPQLILFSGGRAVFERNNWDITPESVSSGLAQLAGVEQPGARPVPVET